ncbi:hypothetical protein STEG23_008821, partial [Scotinomys teguina]
MQKPWRGAVDCSLWLDQPAFLQPPGSPAHEWHYPQVLLCSSGCPGTHYVHQDDLKLTEINLTLPLEWNAQTEAYQNLRQKVDNFVSTHLDKQEWNPAMNKNQLRNGLRQSVV